MPKTCDKLSCFAPVYMNYLMDKSMYRLRFTPTKDTLCSNQKNCGVFLMEIFVHLGTLWRPFL